MKRCMMSEVHSFLRRDMRTRSCPLISRETPSQKVTRNLCEGGAKVSDLFQLAEA